MPFGGDERAVSVVVGAVLMLGILVSALAMYQASAVPNQNSEIEFQHSQTVEGDVQDLRNAIVNTAGDGTDRAVRVRLGTQYPARTWAINPPDPRGTLRTTEPRPLEVRNATVSDPGSYEGNLSELFAPHNTTSIVYEPDYSEIDGQLRTVLDHSLLYHEQTETYNRTLAPEQLLTGDTISVVVLNGTLSESGSDSVTVDAEILSGPSDPVTIEAQPGENISIRLPTQNPAHWVHAIGTSWGENNMTATPDGDEFVVIAFREDSYALQMSRVGVGEGTVSSDEFDISRTDGDSPQSGNSTFEATWNTQDETMTEGDRTSYDVLVTDRQSGDPITGAPVSFLSSASAVSIDSAASDNQTDDLGRATVVVDASADGDAILYATSGDAAARLSVTVEPDTTNGFDVAVDDVTDPVTEGETLSVTASITNTGSSQATQTIELDFDGTGVVDSRSMTIAGGDTETVTLTYETVAGDAGERTITVSSDDDAASSPVTVEEAPTAFSSGTVFVDTSGGNDALDQVRFQYSTTGDPTEVELVVENDDTGETGTDSTTNVGTQLSVPGSAVGNPSLSHPNRAETISITVRLLDADGVAQTCTLSNVQSGGEYDLGSLQCN